jgi:hypothetical protein
MNGKGPFLKKNSSTKGRIENRVKGDDQKGLAFAVSVQSGHCSVLLCAAFAAGGYSGEVRHHIWDRRCDAAPRGP